MCKPSQAAADVALVAYYINLGSQFLRDGGLGLKSSYKWLIQYSCDGDEAIIKVVIELHQAGLGLPVWQHGGSHS
jgi:hypothetical protein